MLLVQDGGVVQYLSADLLVGGLGKPSPVGQGSDRAEEQSFSPWLYA
jgi:hypothetical protein